MSVRILLLHHVAEKFADLELRKLSHGRMNDLAWAIRYGDTEKAEMLVTEAYTWLKVIEKSKQKFPAKVKVKDILHYSEMVMRIAFYEEQEKSDPSKAIDRLERVSFKVSNLFREIFIKEKNLWGIALRTFF